MVYISSNNQKMGLTPSFSTVPVKDCTNCAQCSRSCYARRMLRYKSLREKWEENSAVIRDGKLDEVREAVKRAVIQVRFFRWFVGGDIPGVKFVEMMAQTARECSGVRFLAFTKNYSAVNSYISKFGELPSNLVIIFSGWGDALRPVNPYNLPESDVYNVEDMTRYDANNWRCGGDCVNCQFVGAGCWSLVKGQKVWFKKH